MRRIVALLLATALKGANAQCSAAIQKLVTDQKYDQARAEAEALVKKNPSDDAALHCVGWVLATVSRAPGEVGVRQGGAAGPDLDRCEAWPY